MLRTSALVFILFWGVSAMGQSGIVIRGKIIDQEKKEPLSGASIGIKGSPIGTASSSSGLFELEVPQQYSRDSLLVTHIGYKKYEVALGEIKDLNSLTVYLVSQATLMNEVTVFSQFWLKQYSPEELQEDYKKFYTIMEKVHTGLFDYLPEKKWSVLKDSSLQLCKHPMTHSEFYQLIALHVGKIRNTHTRHGVTDSWYRRKTNIFPFNIQYIGDRLYVAESFLKEASYPKGTEILEINGRTPAEIRSKVWPFIPADGYIETGKIAALNDYFPWYFSLFVEEAKQFTIKLKLLSRDEVILNSPGLRNSFASLSWTQVQKRKKSALELQIDSVLKTAYFRIEDSRIFKDSLKRYFERIENKKIKHLIIDLRGEGGIREEEHVVELYAYLVNRPFRVYDRMEVKSNDYKLFDKDFSFRPYSTSIKHIKEKYFDKLVDSGNGYFLWQEESYIGVFKPAGFSFPGKVYILVDGRNYSASTDFTSLASTLDNVYIVGEETGGEHRSYISGAMFGLVLPNSKIGVKVPTWKSVLAIEENSTQKGRGVIPDFFVTQSVDDFINDRDSIKEFAYKLIRNQK